MKRILIACAFAAMGALTLSGAAGAAPAIGANRTAVQAASANGVVEAVTYRSYRHGRRNWRGDRGYRRGYGVRSYGYNSGPGIYLNFGSSRRGNRGYSDYDRHDRDYR